MVAVEAVKKINWTPVGQKVAKGFLAVLLGLAATAAADKAIDSVWKAPVNDTPES